MEFSLWPVFPRKREEIELGLDLANIRLGKTSPNGGCVEKHPSTAMQSVVLFIVVNEAEKLGGVQLPCKKEFSSVDMNWDTLLRLKVKEQFLASFS